MFSYITVGSITHAARGKSILNANGYKAYLKRANRIDPSDGCGYMITFSGDVGRAEMLLKKAKIKVLGSGEE